MGGLGWKRERDMVGFLFRGDAKEALAKGIIHGIASSVQEPEVVALELGSRVGHLGLNRSVMTMMKKDTKGYVSEGLRTYFDKPQKSKM